MSETSTLPSLSYNAPFGSWAKDFDWKSLSSLAGPMPLSINHTTRVDLFPQHGVVTKFYSSPAVAERIWRIMQLAGDCSVSIVGRLFLEPESTQIMGFCTPIETALDPVNIGTKDERIRLIYQLRDLLADLHSKHLVHGDVKPKNILMCSDGRLRFCDFDNASIEGDGFVSTSMTYPYCSTFRARNDAVPMTRAEDVYAMALSMWEIYTGRVPLTYNGETYEDAEDDLMDRCYAGFLPDMQLIDDPGVASLIESYIAAGPDR
ncbi:kinase-like domain-containing protein, partial [Mycena latifolia]